MSVPREGFNRARTDETANRQAGRGKINLCSVYIGNFKSVYLQANNWTPIVSDSCNLWIK